MPLTALIFDVEGTLMDCVPHMIACWQSILASAGYAVSREELQRYSGMDGGDMLQRLLPALSNQEREALLKVQGDVYRRDYLPLARPFDGVRALFESLKRRGYTVAIATTCTREELHSYDKTMRVLDFTGAVGCSEDANKGKPHPELYQAVLRKLRLADAARAMAIGDTPYDAQAAATLAMPASGVLTGGFSSEELAQAGCSLILGRVTELASCLNGDFPPETCRLAGSAARGEPT